MMYVAAEPPLDKIIHIFFVKITFWKKRKNNHANFFFRITFALIEQECSHKKDSEKLRMFLVVGMLITGYKHNLHMDTVFVNSVYVATGRV